ncbi:MAG: exo-alpha-sialidase [Candidatus Lokiarchaeota archaeon]|nr:exo-alpha-sialidase [Candidatus Lokiarchaeota archaeon]
MKKMELRNPNARIFKWDIVVSCIQLLFSIIFTFIVYLLMDSYSGEFLLVSQSIWILPTFAAILLIGILYSLIMTVISLKSKRFRGLGIDLIKNKHLRLVWVVFWSFWNIAAAFLLYRTFLILSAGVAGGFPPIVITFLSIPFFGYGGLFLIGSLKFYVEAIKLKKVPRLLRGLTAGGFTFLFIFGYFGGVMLFNNPQWTEGVIHQPLFIENEEPSRGYRIPSMIVLPNDTLLAFCESRENGFSDLGDINIVMKKSIDGGDTWSPIQIIQDVGVHTVHNPCPLYDNDTGMVWLPFCIDYQSMHIMNSSDFGETWSTPRNLTQELGLISRCATGPGNGIQMSTGRLIIPTSVGGACAIYSDDHGVTWQKGEYVGRGSEPQAFESVNSSLVFNCRSRLGSYRIMAWSNDGGETWEEWYYEEDLPASSTQGSIMRFTDNVTYMQNRVLFSNPTQNARGHLTLRMSYDEGLTWPVAKLVYEGPSAYSQIAILSDKTICILFETGKNDYRETLTFVKVDLNWLTDGGDLLVPRP